MRQAAQGGATCPFPGGTVARTRGQPFSLILTPSLRFIQQLLVDAQASICLAHLGEPQGSAQGIIRQLIQQLAWATVGQHLHMRNIYSTALKNCAPTRAKLQPKHSSSQSRSRCCNPAGSNTGLIALPLHHHLSMARSSAPCGVALDLLQRPSLRQHSLQRSRAPTDHLHRVAAARCMSTKSHSNNGEPLTVRPERDATQETDEQQLAQHKERAPSDAGAQPHPAWQALIQQVSTANDLQSLTSRLNEAHQQYVQHTSSMLDAQHTHMLEAGWTTLLGAAASSVQALMAPLKTGSHTHSSDGDAVAHHDISLDSTDLRHADWMQPSRPAAARGQLQGSFIGGPAANVNAGRVLGQIGQHLCGTTAAQPDTTPGITVTDVVQTPAAGAHPPAPQASAHPPVHLLNAWISYLRVCAHLVYLPSHELSDHLSASLCRLLSNTSTPLQPLAGSTNNFTYNLVSTLLTCHPAFLTKAAQQQLTAVVWPAISLLSAEQMSDLVGMWVQSCARDGAARGGGQGSPPQLLAPDLSLVPVPQEPSAAAADDEQGVNFPWHELSSRLVHGVASGASDLTSPRCILQPITAIHMLQQSGEGCSSSSQLQADAAAQQLWQQVARLVTAHSSSQRLQGGGCEAEGTDGAGGDVGQRASAKGRDWNAFFQQLGSGEHAGNMMQQHSEVGRLQQQNPLGEEQTGQLEAVQGAVQVLGQLVHVPIQQPWGSDVLRAVLPPLLECLKHMGSTTAELTTSNTSQSPRGVLWGATPDHAYQVLVSLGHLEKRVRDARSSHVTQYQSFSSSREPWSQQSSSITGSGGGGGGGGAVVLVGQGQLEGTEPGLISLLSSHPGASPEDLISVLDACDDVLLHAQEAWVHTASPEQLQHVATAVAELWQPRAVHSVAPSPHTTVTSWGGSSERRVIFEHLLMRVHKTVTQALHHWDLQAAAAMSQELSRALGAGSMTQSLLDALVTHPQWHVPHLKQTTQTSTAQDTPALHTASSQAQQLQNDVAGSSAVLPVPSHEMSHETFGQETAPDAAALDTGPLCSLAHACLHADYTPELLKQLLHSLDVPNSSAGKADTRADHSSGSSSPDQTYDAASSASSPGHLGQGTILPAGQGRRTPSEGLALKAREAAPGGMSVDLVVKEAVPGQHAVPVGRISLPDAVVLTRLATREGIPSSGLACGGLQAVATSTSSTPSFQRLTSLVLQAAAGQHALLAKHVTSLGAHHIEQVSQQLNELWRAGLHAWSRVESQMRTWAVQAPTYQCLSLIRSLDELQLVDPTTTRSLLLEHTQVAVRKATLALQQDGSWTAADASSSLSTATAVRTQPDLSTLHEDWPDLLQHLLDKQPSPSSARVTHAQMLAQQTNRGAGDAHVPSAATSTLLNHADVTPDLMLLGSQMLQAQMSMHPNGELSKALPFSKLLPVLQLLCHHPPSSHGKPQGWASARQDLLTSIAQHAIDRVPAPAGVLPAAPLTRNSHVETDAEVSARLACLRLLSRSAKLQLDDLERCLQNLLPHRFSYAVRVEARPGHVAAHPGGMPLSHTPTPLWSVPTAHEHVRQVLALAACRPLHQASGLRPLHSLQTPALSHLVMCMAAEEKQRQASGLQASGAEVAASLHLLAVSLHNANQLVQAATEKQAAMARDDYPGWGDEEEAWGVNAVLETGRKLQEAARNLANHLGKHLQTIPATAGPSESQAAQDSAVGSRTGSVGGDQPLQGVSQGQNGLGLLSPAMSDTDYLYCPGVSYNGQAVVTPAAMLAALCLTDQHACMVMRHLLGSCLHSGTSLQDGKLILAAAMAHRQAAGKAGALVVLPDTQPVQGWLQQHAQHLPHGLAIDLLHMAAGQQSHDTSLHHNHVPLHSPALSQAYSSTQQQKTQDQAQDSQQLGGHVPTWAWPLTAALGHADVMRSMPSAQLAQLSEAVQAVRVTLGVSLQKQHGAALLGRLADHGAAAPLLSRQQLQQVHVLNRMAALIAAVHVGAFTRQHRQLSASLAQLSHQSLPSIMVLLSGNSGGVSGLAGRAVAQVLQYDPQAVASVTPDLTHLIQWSHMAINDQMLESVAGDVPHQQLITAVAAVTSGLHTALHAMTRPPPSIKAHSPELALPVGPGHGTAVQALVDQLGSAAASFRQLSIKALATNTPQQAHGVKQVAHSPQTASLGFINLAQALDLMVLDGLSHTSTAQPSTLASRTPSTGPAASPAAQSGHAQQLLPELCQLAAQGLSTYLQAMPPATDHVPYMTQALDACLLAGVCPEGFLQKAVHHMAAVNGDLPSHEPAASMMMMVMKRQRSPWVKHEWGPAPLYAYMPEPRLQVDLVMQFLAVLSRAPRGCSTARDFQQYTVDRYILYSYPPLAAADRRTVGLMCPPPRLVSAPPPEGVLLPWLSFYLPSAQGWSGAAAVPAWYGLASTGVPPRLRDAVGYYLPDRMSEMSDVDLLTLARLLVAVNLHFTDCPEIDVRSHVMTHLRARANSPDATSPPVRQLPHSSGSSSASGLSRHPQQLADFIAVMHKLPGGSSKASKAGSQQSAPDMTWIEPALAAAIPGVTAPVLLHMMQVLVTSPWFWHMAPFMDSSGHTDASVDVSTSVLDTSHTGSPGLPAAVHVQGAAQAAGLHPVLSALLLKVHEVLSQQLHSTPSRPASSEVLPGLEQGLSLKQLAELHGLLGAVHEHLECGLLQNKCFDEGESEADSELGDGEPEAPSAQQLGQEQVQPVEGLATQAAATAGTDDERAGQGASTAAIGQAAGEQPDGGQLPSRVLVLRLVQQLQYVVSHLDYTDSCWGAGQQPSAQELVQHTVQQLDKLDPRTRYLVLIMRMHHLAAMQSQPHDYLSSCPDNSSASDDAMQQHVMGQDRPAQGNVTASAGGSAIDSKQVVSDLVLQVYGDALGQLLDGLDSIGAPAQGPRIAKPRGPGHKQPRKRLF